MRPSRPRMFHPTRLPRLFLPLAAVLFLACSGHSSDNPPSRPALSLTPFISVARQSPCHDLRNRLFVIDRHLVFWDRAGNCPENGYAQTLYADSVNTIVCQRHDSFGGPVTTYPDPSYRALFDTMVANLDQPNLGLSSAHTVQAIPL